MDPRPKNKKGYIFIIIKKIQTGEGHLLPNFSVDVKAYIISSSFNLIWSNQACHDAI